MNLKTFKTAQGDLAIYTADFRLNSRRSQKIIYFLTGAAIVSSFWLANMMYDHSDMKAFNDYALIYANNALHNAK